MNTSDEYLRERKHRLARLQRRAEARGSPSSLAYQVSKTARLASLLARRSASRIGDWVHGPTVTGLKREAAQFFESHYVNSVRYAAETFARGSLETTAEVAHVRDLALPNADGGTVRGRLYTPFAAGHGPAPLLIYFHGGGFFTGSLESHDGVCRRLARAGRMRVLSADYRLAPEHRFPAAVDDALAIYDWVSGPGAAQVEADPARLAVGGDSAGGNLSAIIAQHRRGGPYAPRYQMLFYPLMQLVDTKPHRMRVMQGHAVTHFIMQNVIDLYLPEGADRANPLISPLFTDDLSGVCPAYVLTSRIDPLEHEGNLYAQKLEICGVRAQLVRYSAAPHGFLQLENRWDQARDALAHAGEALGAQMGVR